MAKMIVVDHDRCLGCKCCELACSLAHCVAESLAEAVQAGARAEPRVHVEPSGRFGMPMQCHHCVDAPCMAVCPTEAIARGSQDSPVLLDQDRCIGCRLCMVVCPFGAISTSHEGKAMLKCDMCIERTEAGGLPACVTACPSGALKYQDIDEWLLRRRRRSAELLRAATARESLEP